LTDPNQFGDVVVKTDQATGAITRLRDVARVEIGSQDYSIRGTSNTRPAVFVAIQQLPGSNALDTADGVLGDLEDASRDFPQGMEYSIPYNPTEYVQDSVNEVQRTLIEAIALVVLVIVIFLQTWRAAIIPIIAIPVSLIGTFAVQLALGFSINSLSLFALVLAVGIVVDDAIVVVEAVEKHIREGLSPREAAHRTMQEISGALIAIGLVLVAVFVPAALISGIPGIFYRQFAVTIAASAAISTLISLTLSPALAALLLKPHRPAGEHGEAGGRWMRPLRAAGARFNQGFDWLSDHYGSLTTRLVHRSTLMLVIYGGLLGLTVWRLNATPTGFIPDQDQGFLIGVIQLPPGASLDRTEAAVERIRKTVSQNPKVIETAAFAGLDGATFSPASNSGIMFLRLAEHEERRGTGETAAELAGAITGAVAGAEAGAQVFFLSPPPVPGLGNGSGFSMMIQDRGNAGYQPLQGATFAMMGGAQQNPKVAQVFSLFNTGSPRIEAEIDRDRAQLVGVEPSQVYAALSTYLGSTYVNDFNLLGRTFRVTAQAEAAARDDLADVGRLQVRSSTGEMVPISAVATFRYGSGPVQVTRYNNYPAAELQGQTPPGVASGDSLRTMEELAAKNLPPGFGFEWTGLAYQEQAAGNTAPLVFAVAVLCVFMVLAAQYESLTLPLAVILIVPMCVLAAMTGINIRGMDNNILTQIGLIVLIALAAKNAILIVEFARQAEDDQGMNRFDAAVHAARSRLRPILMTSFAFIFGVIPLAIAVGPGAEMRQAMGTAVAFGMVGVTLFGLIFTPVFYVVCRWLDRFMPRAMQHSTLHAHGHPEPAE
jgi:hydrophobe/amphiphile efflux-1 (HAE1) family protein